MLFFTGTHSISSLLRHVGSWNVSKSPFFIEIIPKGWEDKECNS